MMVKLKAYIAVGVVASGFASVPKSSGNRKTRYVRFRTEPYFRLAYCFAL
jgi:hypothetical protein